MDATKHRRKFSSEFKSKVVLEALTERHSIEDLCKRYNLHPNQIAIWKKYFLENSSLVFSQESKSDKKEPQEALIQKLYAQIGELTVACDFLKKKLY